MSILNRARKLAQSLGLEVTRAEPMTTWRRRLPALLRLHQIGIVIDVGANDGGFATELIDNGYEGRIISFEPLPTAWGALARRAHRKAPGRWQVAPRMALGDQDGEVEFFEAGNSVSSSLLPMTSVHVEAAPGSATVNSLRVPVRKLDDFLSALDHPTEPHSGPIHLKIDVQGAERKVLDGAQGALAGPIKMVQMEMSLAELYEGQALAKELYEYMTSRGFKLWDIVPGFRSVKTLRLMQFDGLYVRG